MAVWSNYPQARVGTMDDPGAFPPDIHIDVSSKLGWLRLPPDAKAMPAFYDLPTTWPAESVERLRRLKAKTRAP